MNSHHPLCALLVDPSLFTAPYDAALTEGLLAVGVKPIWAVRPTRLGDQQTIASHYVDECFYRHVDKLTWLPDALRKLSKGLAHGWGLGRLVARVWRERPDIVHFQWAVVPTLDALAMALIRRSCPVVFTVHDTTPFNGDHLSMGQVLGYDLPMRVADRIVVHTEAAHQALMQRGIVAQKLFVIPHGPLKLPVLALRSKPRSDRRWTFLLFGELKPYKGVDLLVEAIALLPTAQRERARFIVAGRPRMDLRPVQARIAELQLQQVVEMKLRRLSDQEMADLFDETDCFVFPYRQIDASGVYFLVRSTSKWLIASKVGVFAEDLIDGVDGSLVPSADPTALAAALLLAISERPTPAQKSTSSSWEAIGQATRSVYEGARLGRDTR